MGYYNQHRSHYPVAMDSDAQAFFTAAGITDSTQKRAINQLVLDLKSASIWTKMVCIYPMVGGNSTSHSYNLKNTSAYRITWSGTLVHDSQGADPNGSSGYGYISLTPASVFSATDHSMSFYSNEITSSSFYCTDMGNNNPSGNAYWNLALWRGGAGNSVYQSGNNGANWTTTQTTAFYAVGSMLGTGTNNITFYQFRGDHHGSTFSASIAGTALPSDTSFTVVLGGHGQSGSIANTSTRRCMFSHIGQGLTSTEVTALYNAVQAYQTTLGRQI